MIWHIFVKDCRLLWPGIGVVALAHFNNSFLWARLGPLSEPRDLISMGTSASRVALLVTVLLIAAAVHQDPIPGTRQDWLVRPIRRRDLLLAKILFVLLAVHGPLFVADAIEGLMQGFSVLASCKAALLRGLSILVKFSLPALALGAVTRDMTQLAFGAFIWFAVPVTLWNLAQVRPRLAIMVDGLGWIVEAVSTLIVLLMIAVILWLQYGRRRTYGAVGLIACTLALMCVPPFISWQPAFAIQQWLAPQRGASRDISIAMDRSGYGSGWSPSVIPDTTLVLMPIQVSGLHADSILLIDDAAVRVIEPGGAVLYNGDSRCFLLNGGGSDCSNRNITLRPAANSNGQARIRYMIGLPTALYQRVQDQSLRIEIDFSLTLFRHDATASIAAIDIEQQLANGSRCATTVNAARALELHCLGPHKMPGCVAVFLEDASDGWRSPEVHRCYPDYAPYSSRIYPDAMNRLGDTMVPYDGLRFMSEVTRKRLATSQTVVKTYETQDHFTRHLTVTDARLRDWVPDFPR